MAGFDLPSNQPVVPILEQQLVGETDSEKTAELERALRCLKEQVPNNTVNPLETPSPVKNIQRLARAGAAVRALWQKEEATSPLQDAAGIATRTPETRRIPWSGIEEHRQANGAAQMGIRLCATAAAAAAAADSAADTVDDLPLPQQFNRFKTLSQLGTFSAVNGIVNMGDGFSPGLGALYRKWGNQGVISPSVQKQDRQTEIDKLGRIFRIERVIRAVSQDSKWKDAPPNLQPNEQDGPEERAKKKLRTECWRMQSAAQDLDMHTGTGGELHKLCVKGPEGLHKVLVPKFSANPEVRAKKLWQLKAAAALQPQRLALKTLYPTSWTAIQKEFARNR